MNTSFFTPTACCADTAPVIHCAYEQEYEEAAVMIWFWELSWLWKMLGVALLVSAVCVAAAALIGKAAKIRPGKKVFLLVGILAFVISILVIFFLAQTPALL